jgi:hypothetical protein
MNTFKDRLTIGHEGEDIIINLLMEKYGDPTTERQTAENRFKMRHDISTMSGRKIEVKRDLRFKQTNNIFIEINGKNGQKSGLKITTAREWFFILDTFIYSITTKQLKKIIKNKELKYIKHSPRNGGGFIIPFNHYKELFIFECVLNI